VTKQNLLVVDADPRSLRVLEVSLRNAGYNVAGCPSVGKAFEILHASKPDLILSDTSFADMNGFEFVEQLRQNSDWSDIPFMFLSSDGSIESKIRGLELGVQDYLTKPIYIREVVARIGIELARQTRAGLARKTSDSRTRFSGSLAEMSVVDLLQTIDVSRKSGVLTLVSADGQEGMISFDSGAVINASVENLRGEDAIYRQLLWRDGSFDLEFRRVSLSERTVHRTTQALLMEGMHRLDEWSRLLELLPSLNAVLEVDANMLRKRLRDLPDEQNSMIRLIDGRSSVAEVLRAHGEDHVEALRKVVDLYFEGLVRERGLAQDSIPVLTEVSVRSSAPPPCEGVNTIPGPAGVPIGRAAVPAAPRVPQMDTSSTSVTADELESVVSVGDDASPDHSVLESRRVSVPPDRRSTPVSLPSPQIEPMDGAEDEEVIAPAASPLPDATTNASSTGTALGWKPAPPPSSSPKARKQTPKGFQAVRPESSLYAGGTILNWAGRVPDIREIEEASTRETAELGRWDQTLQELQSDPEVEEAIETIDSNPPPGPFVRSEPPRMLAKDERPTEGQEEERDGQAASSYHEPPEVDPAPLTYEQVFEETQAPAQAPASRPEPRSILPPRPATTARLRWALLVLVIGCGLAAVVYWRSLELPGPSEGPVTVGERGAVAGPETQTATAGQSAPEPAPEPESAPASGSESAPEPESAPAPASESAPEPVAKSEPPIYPATGAPDTYEAQLALARRLKRGSRAVAAYRRAIELDPKSSPALAELARLMLARRNTREAAELAERATAIDPSNALGWVTLGAARQMRGDRQGAHQAYQSCVKLGRGGYVRECRAMLR
jgi:DNA-binding response OmpR family regulator